MALLMLIWLGLNIAMVQRADWIEVSKEQIGEEQVLRPGNSIK